MTELDVTDVGDQFTLYTKHRKHFDKASLPRLPAPSGRRTKTYIGRQSTTITPLL